MSERARQLREAYAAHRVDHQHAYYAGARRRLEAASGQVAALSATLIAVAAAAGLAQAFLPDARTVLGLVAAILPALATALAAYDMLYGFDRNARLYADALRALDVASAEAPGDDADETAIAAWSEQVEGVLRREQAQWGQLTEEVERTGPSGG